MPVAQLKKNNMKHLHIGVQGDKYNFFIELIKNLNFVKIESGKTPVVNGQKGKALANIKKGFIDRKAIDNDALKTFPIEDLFE